MGQILHGSARTTEAVRRTIQHSQESLRVLAQRYGVKQKTVAKWKKRTSAADLPTGPKAAYTAVARRLSLRASAEDLPPDTVVTASLPGASRHLPTARGRGRQARQEEIHGLSDRLFPTGVARRRPSWIA
jgi:hypothetical protein